MSSGKRIATAVVGWALACAAHSVQALDLSAYFPTPLKATWIYNCTTNRGVSGTTASQVTAVTNPGVVAFVQVDPACAGNEQFVLNRTANQLALVTVGYLQQGSTLQYSPPAGFLPATANVGDTLVSSGTFTVTGPQAFSGTYSANVRIDGVESVATAAGVFKDALRVSQNVTHVFTANGQSVNATIADVRCLLKDVGEVKLT